MTRTAIIGALVAGALAACNPVTGPGPAQGERRGPIELGGVYGASVDDTGLRLSVEVPSCNGDPVIAEFRQEPDAVRIQIVTTEQLGEGDACADSITLTLDAPLGDRQVIDLTSGDVLEVAVRP